MLQSEQCPWYIGKYSMKRLPVFFQLIPRIILDMGSANERQYYIVMASLIGWTHTQNDTHCMQIIHRLLVWTFYKLVKQTTVINICQEKVALLGQPTVKWLAVIYSFEANWYDFLHQWFPDVGHLKNSLVVMELFSKLTTSILNKFLNVLYPLTHCGEWFLNTYCIEGWVNVFSALSY